MDTQLSSNFYLSEFTRSQTAARLGREIVVDKDSRVYQDLRRLCDTVLQPLREALGPVFISSGYRPKWLEWIISKATRSQHMHGQAADFTVSGFSPFEVVAWLMTSTLPFDQLIYEFGQWVHVSIAPADRAPRRQVLTAYKFRRRFPWLRIPPRLRPETRYAIGLHKIEDLAA